MWTTSFTGHTSAAPDAVWRALRAMISGTPLGESGDTYELHGEFAVGTAITMTPQGQDAVQSVITELDVDRCYADVTEFGDLRLTFRHRLDLTSDGGTDVTHTLEIDGAGADQAGQQLGSQISSDFPEAMGDLLRAAEAGVGGD